MYNDLDETFITSPHVQDLNNLKQLIFSIVLFSVFTKYRWVREFVEMWYNVLVGQIKPKHIYYYNPGLIVIGGLFRQPVRVYKSFIKNMDSEKM